MSVDTVEYTYYAFVSHSHRDAKWATWIQNALERYRLPSSVRKAVRKPLPKRLAPVFRDATDLGSCQLVEGLHRELEASRFLIVICSPDSAKPNAEGKHYVDHEVDYFAGLGRADRIIPVIVRGTPEESFGPKIRELDLLALDATKASRSRVLNDIVAKILGLRPDELWRRERRRQLIRRIELSVLGAAAALVVAVGGLFAWDATRKVENYYADYVDSYGLPEGIFPLAKDELRGRNIHYRFEYQGIRFGKSIHADSADWSFVNLFGCQRVLRRVVQANSAGRPREVSHAERVERSAILEFEYGKGEILRQIACRAAYGKFQRRLVLSDSEDTVNGAVELKGERSSQALMAMSSVTVAAPIDAPVGRSRIAQFQLARNEMGRETERRFKDVTGNDFVSDVDGICGFSYVLDDCGRPVEVWHLDVSGERRENKKGVAGEKYRYTGRNMVRVEYVNAVGMLTPGHRGWAVRVDEFDDFDNNNRTVYYDADGRRTAGPEGCAEIRGEYETGNMVRYVCIGEDGMPTLGRDGFAEEIGEYDGRGNAIRCRFLGLDGKPTTQKDGYAEWRREYDGNGCITKCQFFDADGKPTPDGNGVAEACFEYDGRGNGIRIRFFGPDGRPTLHKEGIAGWRSEYDGRGNEIRRSYFGVDDEPVLHKDGYAGFQYVYDGRGNLVRSVFFGLDGNPILDKSGYSEWRSKYDECGNESCRMYFGTDGRLILGKVGVAGWRSEYDGRGNELQRSYFDADERPVLFKDGYAVWRCAYDDRGNVTNKMYLGVDGKPTLCKTGIAGWRSMYDGRGNETHRQYFGIDALPALHKDGNAGYRCEYDGRGNATNVSYFGVVGEPTLIRNGYSRVVREYDARGNVTSCAYFGVDGRPVLSEEGIAGSRSTYDGRGNVMCRLYFGVDGGPVLIKDGYAGFRSEYNKFGASTRIVYLGVDGNPTLCKDGYAEERVEYDERGNAIRCLHLGVDGKPTLLKSGIAGWQREYDERGNVTRNFYFDENGKLAVSAEGYAEARNVYDARGNIIESTAFDENGKPAYRKLGGFASVRIEYDELGREVRCRSFDGDGNLTAGTYGYAELRKSYDARGNQIEERQLGLDGKLCLGASGVAIRQWEYDALGRQVRALARGTDGKLCRGTSAEKEYAVPDIRVRYDARGNKIEERYFDVTGAPYAYQCESCGVTWKFDDLDRIIRLTYVGPDGRPYRHHMKGYASVEYEYDDRGNLACERFRDADGNPVAATDGNWAAVVWHDYDKRNHEVRKLFFDASDKPVEGAQGTAEVRLEYDRFGRVVRRVHLGGNGLARDSKFGPADTRVSYDVFGNVAGERYFDGRGCAVTNENGIAGWQAEYDARGNCTRYLNLGVAGRPVVGRNGCAEIRRTYDRMGRLTRVVYHGPEGNPIRVNGSAGVEYDYDKHGNLIGQSQVDENLRRIASVGGQAFCKYEYDGEGRQIATYFVDGDGNATTNASGCTEVHYAYWPGTKVVMTAERIGVLKSPRLFNETGVYRAINEQDSTGKQVSVKWFDVSGSEIALTNVVVFGETVSGMQAESLGFKYEDVCCRFGGYSIFKPDDYEEVGRSVTLQSRGEGTGIVRLARKTGDRYRVFEVNLKPGPMGVRIMDETITVRRYNEIVSAVKAYEASLLKEKVGEK